MERGGNFYEIIATRDDLGILLRELTDAIDQFDAGNHRALKLTFPSGELAFSRDHVPI